MDFKSLFSVGNNSRFSPVMNLTTYRFGNGVNVDWHQLGMGDTENNSITNFNKSQMTFCQLFDKLKKVRSGRYRYKIKSLIAFMLNSVFDYNGFLSLFFYS